MRQYAGDFDCSICGTKRMTAMSFSKSMVNKRLKNPQAEIKCRDCVENAANAERETSARKATAGTADDVENASDASPLTCSACKEALPLSSFSAKQRRKEEGARCMSCISKAEATERANQEKQNVDALADAQAQSAAAANGGTGSRFAAAIAETTAEASLVTGLKPVKIGRGRGGWRARAGGRGASRGAGRGRGRSTDGA